ncbi:ATP-binding cassette domain-containing protein [Streptomyces sp. LHD-70]|uniref:ATP-binding cassette domain-containing protein n=1 Tax=Streptomyces sp. LHD-70 TaxID=3072140 RepID=UPI00280D6193|nr:ATP-binding cassette domain-containing protein [Streptomyces sp. LHD-70]MDQ8703653.1 ATP-binding cassette domain-containing protein [Streptomyces sp. LHD-70]
MRLTGVGRRYGPVGPWVLRGVDLEVPPGALLRISGANGSGKSTLLRLLAGIDTPSEGRITGRPRTAYVPERFPSALPFTAIGYLTHLGRVHGLPGPVAADRATAWLTRFGAEEHAGTQLRELSKGTSQKVAVSQALLAEPELLVLDEAWTGLDAEARAELDLAVGELTSTGARVVYVDHDPRRLAGSMDAAHRVEGTALVPDTTRPPEPTPQVTVLARARAGTPLPAALPEGTHAEVDAAGTARFTVAAAHSDTLLRTLLHADPPWHIRAVREPVAGANTPEDVRR